MHARAAGPCPDSRRGGDLAEVPAGSAAVQGGARAGQEERSRAGPGAEPVALGRVLAQRGGRGGVQRDQPLAAVPGLADRDHSGVQADVAAAQGDGLADPHARDGKKPEQGLQAAGQQRRPDGPRPGEQPADLVFAPEIRGTAVASRGEHACRGYLGGRVQDVQPGSEPPYRAGPGCPLGRLRGGGLACPVNRVPGDNGRRSGGLKVGAELAEQLFLAFEPVSQCPPQPEVVRDVRAQRAHRSCSCPGHGSASSRSRPASARAYRLVVCSDRCRSTWAASTRGTPAKTISQAVV
jgi:hypothetical protein